MLKVSFGTRPTNHDNNLCQNAHLCGALSNIPGLCRDSFCSPQRSQRPGIASVYRNVPIQSLRGESDKPDVSDTDRISRGTLHACIHFARAVFGLAAGCLWTAGQFRGLLLDLSGGRTHNGARGGLRSLGKPCFSSECFGGGGTVVPCECGLAVR